MSRMPPKASSVPINPETAASRSAFGEQLPHDPSGVRSKRSANGHLARASGVARQREACDVGSGDEEHAKHGAAEHPQCQSRLGSDHVKTQRDDADALVPFDRRQLIVDAAGDGAHLRLGLVERHARSKSSNDEPRSARRARCGGSCAAPTRLRRPRDLEISRENADDLGRKPVDARGSLRAHRTSLRNAPARSDD